MSNTDILAKIYILIIYNNEARYSKYFIYFVTDQNKDDVSLML